MKSYLALIFNHNCLNLLRRILWAPFFAESLLTVVVCALSAEVELQIRYSFEGVLDEDAAVIGLVGFSRNTTSLLNTALLILGVCGENPFVPVAGGWRLEASTDGVRTLSTRWCDNIRITPLTVYIQCYPELLLKQTTRAPYFAGENSVGCWKSNRTGPRSLYIPFHLTNVLRHFLLANGLWI